MASDAWVRREALLASLLFFATAAFVLWQNSRIAILWDLGYLLDTSWRICLGQVPYRDFPLVHAPLTFLIQAAIMRVAGRHYLLHIAYAALAGGLGTVIAWRILLGILQDKIDSAWAVALLLASPLTVLGVYSIYLHPIYDCDCAIAILVAIFLLQRVATGESRAWFATGVASVVPVLFKQNMGLPFLMAVVTGVVALLILNRLEKSKSVEVADASLLRCLAGVAVASLAAVTLIQVSVGLDNYLHWTVRFAAERRLPGFGEMLAVYRQPSFVWTLPAVGCGALLLCLSFASRLWAQIAAFCLLSAPLVASVIYLFLNGDLDERADHLLALWPMLLILAAAVAVVELRKGITLSRLLPLFILAAIHGTLLSQQLWGSTYAIWPLLMLLIAQMLTAIPAGSWRLVPALAAVVSATFLICGGLYASSLERLDYAQIPDGSVYRSKLPALRGMTDRGPYLPDFEELVRFSDLEIPAQDGILLLPGEEPFYFATGRVPQFPVQIFDRTTDPYSARELLEAARNRNIRWVIVKTRLQLTDDPLPERAQTMLLVQKEFRLYRKLAVYDVYLRR